jgi:hypothetical protein
MNSLLHFLAQALRPSADSSLREFDSPHNRSAFGQHSLWGYCYLQAGTNSDNRAGRFSFENARRFIGSWRSAQSPESAAGPDPPSLPGRQPHSLTASAPRLSPHLR